MIDRVERRPGGFLLAYALANAGGVIAFLPLLTILLPLKVEAIAGPARLSLLAAAAIAGAVAASGANILFGWLSDVSRARGIGRRRWVAGGLAATAIAYAGIALTTTPLAIVSAVFVFQVTLNGALAPLYAIMADEIPDAQKGVTGGLLAFANPVAAGMGAIVAGLAAIGENGRLALVIAASVLCITPLLAGRPRPVVTAMGTRDIARVLRRDLAATWAARLMAQISGVVLQFYLLYYFESIARDIPRAALPALVGRLLLITFIVPLPVALVMGRLSDRFDRRKPFLLASALIAAAGLVGMAGAQDWGQGAAAYGVYTMGAGVFLPLQSAFSMQLLPDPNHRGRDLGLLNLSNTLPSLIGPLLIWGLATPDDFGAVMLILALLTLGGGLAMLTVRARR